MVANKEDLNPTKSEGCFGLPKMLEIKANVATNLAKNVRNWTKCCLNISYACGSQTNVRLSLYHIEMCLSYHCCWRGGWVIKKMLTVVGVLEPPLNWHSTWTTPNPTLVLVTMTRPTHVRQESYSGGVPQLTYQRHNSAREIYLVWDTPPSPPYIGLNVKRACLKIY